MQIVFILLIFMLGASIGSFLSVLINRINKKQKGIIFGHSFCPKCKKRLKPLDLVPLLSYIILKGKCRYCHRKIDPSYMALEMTTGLAFVAVFGKYTFFRAEDISMVPVDWIFMVYFILLAAVCTLMVAIFFFDLKYQEIPTNILIVFILSGLTAGLVFTGANITGMIIALVLALVLFGGQILISKGKWLGEGDLYIGIGMALLLGWEKFLVAFVASYLLGALVSISLLLTGKAKTKSKIAFAPFLVIGTCLAIFFGQYIVDWYISLLYIK